MSCSECCLWLVEFLLQSERMTDPKHFDDDDDEYTPEGDNKPKRPDPPHPNPNAGGGANGVPSIDTAALAKDDHEIKEFKRDRMKQLFNKHGFNLAVFPGGSVKGSIRQTSKYQRLRRFVLNSDYE